jgi:hypothetical protein
MFIAKKCIGPIHASNVSNSSKMFFFSSKIPNGVINCVLKPKAIKKWFIFLHKLKKKNLKIENNIIKT